MRVLIAVPTNAAPATTLVENDVAIDTARIVILTASTLHGLNEHTARLQTAAAFVDWELDPPTASTAESSNAPASSNPIRSASEHTTLLAQTSDGD